MMNWFKCMLDKTGVKINEVYVKQYPSIKLQAKIVVGDITLECGAETKEELDAALKSIKDLFGEFKNE